MPVPLSPGESVEIEVADLAYGGAGVGRHQGFVVLVPRSAPGDRLRARILATHPGYAVGRIDQILQAAADRVAPRCRHFAECGGCAYQHIDAARQSEIKTAQVRETLRRIGRLPEPPLLAPITAPSAYGYRTRVDLTACLDAGGRTRLGFHRADDGARILPVQECLISSPAVEALRARLDALLSESRLQPFDPRTRHGYLRRVVLRASSAGETLVELRTASLSARPLRELVKSLQEHPRLRGIVQVLDRGARRSSTGPSRLLWGSATLREVVCGQEVEFPAGAFAQTHAVMMPVLYEEARRACGHVEGRACLDLYCGAGVLSLLLARAGAREVLGVEADAGAVSAARRNARRNAARACRFASAEVGQALRGLGPPATGGRYERALVNPPRGGLSSEALGQLAAIGPERISYVSCDPATLARDLKRLGDSGYRVEWVRPFDLFPQTAHVETVTALARN